MKYGARTKLFGFRNHEARKRVRAKTGDFGRSPLKQHLAGRELWEPSLGVLGSEGAGRSILRGQPGSIFRSLSRLRLQSRADELRSPC